MNRLSLSTTRSGGRVSRALATLVLGSLGLASITHAHTLSPRDDLALGVGYQSGVDKARASTCLESFETREEQFGDGQRTRFSIELLTESRELSKRLNVDASVNVDVNAGFGHFDAGAKAEFARTKNRNRKSLFLVVSSVVRNGILTVEKAKLAAPWNDATLGFDAFRQACGDRYVKGLVTGGEFYGVVEFVTQNEETKEVLAAKLNAAYQNPVTKVDAKVDVTTESLLRNTRTQVNYWYFQAGGGANHDPHKGPKSLMGLTPLKANLKVASDLGASLDAKDPVASLNTMVAKMVEQAEALDELVRDKVNAVPLALALSDYFAGVENFPYLKDPNLKSYVKSYRVLDDLSATRLELLRGRALAESVLEQKADYALTPNQVAELLGRRERLLDLEAKTVSAIEACADEVLACKVPTELDSAVVQDWLGRRPVAKSRYQRAMEFVAEQMNARCYRADKWSDRMCFRFDLRDRAPYSFLEPGVWKNEGTVFADRLYFLNAPDYADRMAGFIQQDEQPTVVLDAKGEVDSATYYFGYRGTYLGIAKIEFLRRVDGTYSMRALESPRWGPDGQVKDLMWRLPSTMDEVH